MVPTEKPILRAASCCNVEVVKGGAGVRFEGFVAIEPMVKRAFCSVEEGLGFFDRGKAMIQLRIELRGLAVRTVYG